MAEGRALRLLNKATNYKEGTKNCDLTEPSSMLLIDKPASVYMFFSFAIVAWPLLFVLFFHLPPFTPVVMTLPEANGSAALAAKNTVQSIVSVFQSVLTWQAPCLQAAVSVPAIN